MRIKRIIFSQAITLCALMLPSVTFAATETLAATAKLAPTQGNSVNGNLSFAPVPDGVKVTGDITGLAPGKHGFHIHAVGDCSAPDGSSAGGHFMVGEKQHGAPTAAMHHEGDLGNIEADASGKAHIDLISKTLSLSGANSVVGRSVIVHEREDDMTTQPTGNAGGRIACGVIVNG